MTAWGEVFGRGRIVARDLRRKRVQTTHYNPANGESVTGWLLHNLWGASPTEERYPGDYNFKETWSDEYLVLGVKGVIYKYTILKEEYGAGWSGEHKGTTVETTSVYRMDPRSTWIHGKRIRTDEVMDALDLLDR